MGIGIGLFIQGIILASLKSFGVSYLLPYAPISSFNTDASYFVPPIWHRERRSTFLNTKKQKSQAKISRKWKYMKGI